MNPATSGGGILPPIATPSDPAAGSRRHFRRMVGLGLLVCIALSGCRTADPAFRPTWARFFLESADGRGMPLVLPQSEVRITVNQRPVFTEADIINVDIAQVELGRCLAFQLSSSATRDCYRLTGSSQGRRLVLAINGEPFGARRIEGPIANGLVMVFVELPDSALPALVSDMRRSTAKLQKELARK